MSNMAIVATKKSSTFTYVVKQKRNLPILSPEKISNLKMPEILKRQYNTVFSDNQV